MAFVYTDADGRSRTLSVPVPDPEHPPLIPVPGLPRICAIPADLLQGGSITIIDGEVRRMGVAPSPPGNAFAK